MSNSTGPQANVLRIDATHDNGTPNFISASMLFETEAARDEALAVFPKSAKVRASTLSWFTGSTSGGTFQSHQGPTIVFDARLRATGVTGAVNETGIRRYKAFRKAAQVFDIDWRMGFTNSMTEAELNEALG